MKKLLLLLSLLLVANTWALEQEDAIELTCKLDLVVFQLHLTQDESTSWYKVTRKSNKTLFDILNKPLFDHLERRRSWNDMHSNIQNVSLKIFFPTFKYDHDLDSYFDVPQYKILFPIIEKNNLRFSFLPLTIKRSLVGHSYLNVSNHAINRTTGNIISYSNSFPSRPLSGNCVQGLVDWIEKEVERKF